MATYGSFKKITNESIIDGAVTATKLASGAITTDKINSNAIATGDIQDGSVGTSQLASSLDLSGKTVSYRPFVNSDFGSSVIGGAQLASGAIASNLGYTPLNKAGGTVSGQLKLANGSAGGVAIGPTGDDNTGIHFPGSSTVRITTGGGDRMVVDSGGRTQEPNRPAFYASGLGGWYYWNTFGGAGWRELTGIGWSFNTQGQVSVTSNVRVTAPISGYYWFYLQSYYYNDNNSTSGYTHWNIGRNGSTGTTSVNGRHPHSIFSHGLPNNYTPGIMVSNSFYMNAGDWASPQPYGPNGPGRFHADHSLWCGFLIG